eukprot:TRINITY_DN22704_c0_g1_i2.p1 TRINITY_DN22704_c0_g1~~TRINITY_DN22704_c0_g1_i2.p1  ORF type:complete len:182 (+),score=34.65 TRINITY_DN22704_c0_g1_i2:48-548(+)
MALALGDCCCLPLRQLAQRRRPRRGGVEVVGGGNGGDGREANDAWAASAVAAAASGVSRSLRLFCWNSLQTETKERQAFCEAVSARGYVVLLMPPSLREAVGAMRTLAAEFFALPREERCALGRLRVFPGRGVIGYRRWAEARRVSWRRSCDITTETRSSPSSAIS